MPTDRDEESGRFQEKYPKKTFVAAVKDLDTATTSNVAERVGCSYDLAYRRLNALAEAGKIEKTTIGSSFIWEMG